ncbi:hypothetical protein FDP41_001608 [Naegleria fowleri]|uniref:RGS domain-containing protein n=1 Tax=Naegleria fowleri TaxID=5763 RepID=A0A6A5C157_NAEFO|nr:uncharacterized protein FDP41_001608 [Naegleria fowleri]KAF0979265.1 hypothetical protein FDP41_001608 [Naegleria fowleri]
MISQHSQQQPSKRSSGNTYLMMTEETPSTLPEDLQVIDHGNLSNRLNATCQNDTSPSNDVASDEKSSSTRKTSSSSKTKRSSFDPSKYMIVYSEAMKCKDFRKTFCDFLKMCHHEESIEFLNLVEQYQTDYEKSVKEMGGWVNNGSFSSINGNVSFSSCSVVNVIGQQQNQQNNLFLTGWTMEGSPWTMQSPIPPPPLSGKLPSIMSVSTSVEGSSSSSSLPSMSATTVRKMSNASYVMTANSSSSGGSSPSSTFNSNETSNSKSNNGNIAHEKITFDQLLSAPSNGSSFPNMESTELPQPSAVSQPQQPTTSSMSGTNATTTTTGGSGNALGAMTSSSPSSPFQIFSQTSLRNGSNVKLGKKNVKLLFESVKSIIENYIHIGCEKELNLGATQRNILNYWNEVFENVDHFLNLGGYSDTSSSNSEGSSSATTNGNGISSPVSSTSSVHSFVSPRKETYFHTMCNIVFTQLDPEKLFGQALFNVNLDLKLDQFPRFVRSDMLIKFLKEKGEVYTRSIAVDISKGFKGDMRWKPNDLKNRIITDDYIYFGFNVADDTPDWELIYNTTTPYLCQGFVSKTPYVFDSENMKGMKLAKMVLHIPFSLDIVWNCYCNTEFAKRFDKMANSKHILSRHIPPAKQPPYSVERPPYALQFASNALNLFFLLKTRQMSYSSTAIYDPFIDMYMFLAHSAEFEPEDNLPTDIGVKAHGLVYYMFYRVSEKLTRIVHIIYGDMNLPVYSDQVMKVIWKKRVKEHQKGFAKILNEMTENGTISMEQLSRMEDGHNTKLCVSENREVYGNRSWYKEWLNLKKEKPQHY